ncbi:hypothetical protein ACH4VX_16615 [Streptomyces sp. NPDC020731]|uniref:hypothetical protein n=1 Tax=Streptomyces sp. NPDC020731 TaxID=3365085 RepID=UPI00378D4BB2
MDPRGNTLRLTAVSALVVLTLTGFSTGRGHGGSSGDGGGGGGCSSSGQNHDSSSSGGGSHRDYDDDDDHDSSGSGGSASSSELDASVELVDCASEETPYATVEVTNQNAADGVFTVTVRFEDATGAEVVTRSQDVAVPGSETVPIRVNVGDGEDVTRIAECDPGMYAPVAR